jgi:hypothetical protein
MLLWITVLACVALSSCAGASRSSHHVGANAPGSSRQASGETAATVTGTQCVPYGKSAPEGPRSYLISDLGKPGVPELDGGERQTVRQIQRYVHAKTLRFAFVGRFSQEFIVFNAKLGPCLDTAGAYTLLNGECGDFYEPGEDPWYTHALPGGICGPSRPWIPGDPGTKVDPSFWVDP